MFRQEKPKPQEAMEIETPANEAGTLTIQEANECVSNNQGFCPNGHQMRHFVNTDLDHCCDKCGADDSDMYGCQTETCYYDLCSKCYNNATVGFKVPMSGLVKRMQANSSGRNGFNVLTTKEESQ